MPQMITVKLLQNMFIYFLLPRVLILFLCTIMLGFRELALSVVHRIKITLSYGMTISITQLESYWACIGHAREAFTFTSYICLIPLRCKNVFSLWMSTDNTNCHTWFYSSHGLTLPEVCIDKPSPLIFFCF